MKEIKGKAVFIGGDNIDTDQILPAKYMKALTFTGLEQHLFETARCQSDFILNQPQATGAKILLVEENFGCGSSREHAPQAIKRWGFEAIVGISFAEIFANNCRMIGLPLFQIQKQDSVELKEKNQTELKIDLKEQQLLCHQRKFELQISSSDLQACTRSGGEHLQTLLEVKNLVLGLAQKKNKQIISC